MLIEKIVLASVKTLPQMDVIEVAWDRLIVRGEGEEEEIVSRTPHRKAYGRGMKSEFAAEVENADAYISVMGW